MKKYKLHFQVNSSFTSCNYYATVNNAVFCFILKKIELTFFCFILWHESLNLINSKSIMPIAGFLPIVCLQVLFVIKSL